MSRTVLVVDDEPDILLAVRLMLEADGYTVIEAGNSEDALELAETQKAGVEAIFLDLRMPGVDGWAMLKALRANGMSHLPVIVLSAYCDPVAIEQSAELGARGYLSKPFEATDLTQTLEGIFESPSDPRQMSEECVEGK
jgi:CheY-like chemotaxis protein